MSDSSKRIYESPVLIDFGTLAEGLGDCLSGGSASPGGGIVCSNGANATGSNCKFGSSAAPGNCQSGGTAMENCQDGILASTGPTGNCQEGTTVLID